MPPAPPEIRELTAGHRATLDAICAACREADAHDPLDEAARLRLKHHGTEASRLWLEADGFALVHNGSLDLAVVPGSRGRGLGTALAEAAAGGASQAWSHGNHPAAARLARRHGFAPVRELWVMRQTGPVPPDQLDQMAQAPGIRLRHFAAGDESELLRVNAAAFARHREQGTMTAAGLAERMAEPWFDPEGLIIAGDPDQQDRVLGFHWTKRHSAQTGEVYVVAIAPEAQGRGLGRALTAAGLRHLHGTDEVILYVDSDNAAALATYASLGFTHAAGDTHVQYSRGG
jgi:mycothiol synthase